MPPVPLGELVARVALIVLQIALAYYLGRPLRFATLAAVSKKRGRDWLWKGGNWDL